MTPWLPHDGGPMPVAADTMVKARGKYLSREAGEMRSAEPAYVLAWDVVTEYRIITPPPVDPRDAEIARLKAALERETLGTEIALRNLLADLVTRWDMACVDDPGASVDLIQLAKECVAIARAALQGEKP